MLASSQKMAGFKESNYKNTSKSIHYEKIVVRNLIKIIPRQESKLSSIIAYDENYNLEITPHEDVTNNENENALEAAKKELSEPQKVVESETKNEQSVKTDAQSFF